MSRDDAAKEAWSPEALIEALMAGGAKAPSIEPVCAIDRALSERRAVWFLKHDVHAVPLQEIRKLAEAETARDLHATYFFLVPDHPASSEAYGTEELLETGRLLVDLGHEVGLHLDPYFLIEWRGQPLRDTIAGAAETFRSAGIPVRTANTHGNTAYRYTDRDGWGISFEVYEELARQPDFPALVGVDPVRRELIRRHRFRIRDLGFLWWGDVPLWSASHGYAVMPYVSDNPLGRRGTWDYTIFAETRGRYKLSDRQPPGARSAAEARDFVVCENGGSEGFDEGPARFEVDPRSPAHTDAMRRLASGPAQFLLHPQFYGTMSPSGRR